MSDQPIDVSIVSRWDGQGAAAAARGMVDVSQSATAVVTQLRAATDAAGLSESAFLELAGALSTEALAAGDAVRADQLLAAAGLGASTAASQLAVSEEEVAAASAAAAAGQTEAASATVNMSAAFKEAKGAANLLSSGMAALLGVRIVAGLTEDGAAALQTEQRFNQLAIAAHTTGPALLAALKSASGGEISELNLQLEASKAEFLGVASSAQDFSILVAIARNNAQSMGLTAQDAFDKLVDGLDKGSVRALKQVGLSVDLKEAEQAYALSVGKTVGQLDAAEKKQALVTAAVKQGQTQLMATGGAAADASVSYQQFGAAVDDAKTKVGELLALDFTGAVQGVGKVATAVAQATDWYNKWAKQNQDLANAIGGWINPIQTYNNAVLGAGRSVLEWAGVLQKVPPAAANANAATATYTGGLQANTSAANAETVALVASIEKKQAAAVQTEALNAVQKTLAELGPMVASGMTIAGEAAMQMSSKYGIAYADALKLINAQAQLAGVGATLLAGQQKNTQVLATPGIGAPGVASGANNSIDAVVALQEAQAAADKARAEGILKNGTATQVVTERQRELNQAIKDHGANSAEAITAQGLLTDAQQKATAAAKQATDDQIALAEATKDTATARKLLNQELAEAKAAGDLGEQARIIKEINGLDKEHNTGLSKTLSLNESIRDSKAAQYKASLDIRELEIKDRQADRDAVTKDRTAQNIINALAGRTDSRANDLRGRAEDVIALDAVENDKRAQALVEKRATAGGSLSSTGKILQSKPGDVSGATVAGPQNSSSAGGAAPSPVSVAPTGSPQVYTFQLVDQAGAVIAKLTEPFIMDALMKGVQTVKARVGA